MSEQVVRFEYDGESSERLDKVLAARFPEHSRSRMQGLIRDGFVRVNQKVVSKTGFTVESGMTIEVHLPAVQSVELEAEAIPLKVIFDHPDVIVIDKPAGLVVHPAAGHESGTLVNAVIGLVPDLQGIGGELRPGIVHRLDKDTSGLILIAKNERAHRFLQDQFRLRQVKKVYLALVDGKPPTPNGRIEASIGRDPAHRKRMAIVPDVKGRESITEYFTRESFSEHTLIEAHPLTGRTHQIRLHLAFIGCPIAGDTVYGRRKVSLPLNRHFLHAAQLTIRLPGEKQPRTFESPLPPELEQILQQLRRS
ncbi:MAG: putative RNA pseudouridine synthase [Bellilinea sp.]|nr:MAG: putative RNA pseudouridine synthase [Bellilinea sp.]